jgi:hypothetical protein
MLSSQKASRPCSSKDTNHKFVIDRYDDISSVCFLLKVRNSFGSCWFEISCLEVSSSMFKTKFHSSASMSLRLNVVHLHVVVEVTLGARKNECHMNDRKIQVIHSRLWLRCTRMVRGQMWTPHFSWFGACSKCASSNTHLHSLLTFFIISSMFLF